MYNVGFPVKKSVPRPVALYCELSVDEGLHSARSLLGWLDFSLIYGVEKGCLGKSVKMLVAPNVRYFSKQLCLDADALSIYSIIQPSESLRDNRVYEQEYPNGYKVRASFSSVVLRIGPFKLLFR